MRSGRGRRKLRLALLGIGLAFLTGCAAATSEPSVCPRVVEYTPEQQARAADELDALPADAMLVTMMADYGRERAMLRACRG